MEIQHDFSPTLKRCNSFFLLGRPFPYLSLETTVVHFHGNHFRCTAKDYNLTGARKDKAWLYHFYLEIHSVIQL